MTREWRSMIAKKLLVIRESIHDARDCGMTELHEKFQRDAKELSRIAKIIAKKRDKSNAE
jgi:hypothetical protein